MDRSFANGNGNSAAGQGGPGRNWEFLILRGAQEHWWPAP